MIHFGQDGVGCSQNFSQPEGVVLLLSRLASTGPLWHQVWLDVLSVDRKVNV